MLSLKGFHFAVSRSTVEGLIKHGAKRLVAGPLQIQVATMKATHGEKYPYAKPWPYETKKFTILHDLLDNTSERMNENSKVIAVEGNVGVGKSAFAQRLAEEFDLKVFEQPTDTQLFTQNGYDIRNLDELLPENARSYDLQRFLSDSKLKNGLAARLQLLWYVEKYHQYTKALAHLFHTGQGVVVVRSPFSDMVFVDAMRKMGWITKQFNDFYTSKRKNTICEILRPHLTIYLDAPVDVLRQRIKARNNPNEVNSATLSDTYLQALDTAHKQKFLPEMRQTGEVLEIDWTEVADQLDMDAIAEEIALLELRSEDNEDPKFHEWTMLDEEEMCYKRRVFSDWGNLFQVFRGPIPFECEELVLSHEDTEQFRRIVHEHPALKYERGWASELGHSPEFRL